MRSEREIDELMNIWQEQLDILMKEPERLVLATGGNVPPVVSQIQVVVTRDMATLLVNTLKYVKGNENGVLQVSKMMNERLKSVEVNKQ